MCCGGAGLSAARHMEDLIEAGVDAHMVTLRKENLKNDRIIEIADRKGRNLFNFTRVLIGSALSRSYPERPNGYEYFTLSRGVDLSAIEVINSAGLIHLHWIDGLVDWIAGYKVFANKLIIYKLGSEEPYTGGCHFSAGCNKFKTDGCRNCPQLGPSFDGNDLAKKNFAAKQRGYRSLNITAVTAGHWLADSASKSLLMKQFPRYTIPNSIDIGMFSPIPQNHGRELFNLPRDRKIILFGAWGIARRNKGLHLLIYVLNILRERWRNTLPVLVIFGEGLSFERRPKGYEWYQVGTIEDRRKLTALYSAADVFVSSSFQEAFGLVTAEAQSCGTPGIGFYGTGAEDIIQDGVTGYLAKHPGLPLENGKIPSRDEAYRSFSPESVEDLAEKIKKILELHPDEYEAMRRACREHAVAEYSPVRITERYLRLYRDKLGLPDVTLDNEALHS
jgi:glycosyltransferase involved in cell wall biosynthesis